MSDSEQPDNRGARIQVSPEPTAAETAAIIAAIQHVLARRATTGTIAARSLWREAARTQSLRGPIVPSRDGWLRASRLGR